MVTLLEVSAIVGGAGAQSSLSAYYRGQQKAAPVGTAGARLARRAVKRQVSGRTATAANGELRGKTPFDQSKETALTSVRSIAGGDGNPVSRGLTRGFTGVRLNSTSE